MQHSLNQLLFAAARAGEAFRCTELVEAKADVTARDPDDYRCRHALLRRIMTAVATAPSTRC
jgi:hypothetical protein